jgi:hypothetical protein
MPDKELIVTAPIITQQTCIIAGNGPSLRDVPRPFLDSHPSFGSNRCYLPGGYIPDYYVVVNNLLIEQFHIEIAAIHCKAKFVKAQYAHLIPGAIPIRSIPQHIFSTDPAQGIYEGYTVTFAAMQLAYWMGFDTILLVGCDHNYQQEGKPNQQQKMAGDDPNHFNPKYFSESFWNLADLEKMTASYELARDAYEKDGRKIINLTPNSKLNVFEREDIGKWSN